MNFVITGASGGLGIALIRKLSQNQENKIYALDIKFNPELKNYNNVFFYKLDVSKYQQWEKILNQIEKKDNVEILINAAGMIIPRYGSDVSQKEIENQIRINLMGTLYGSTLAARRMKKRNYGHIINISSLAGIAPIPGISIYSATKFAVRSFSIALAYELKPFSVNVSVVCPDAIKTSMLNFQKDFQEANLTFSAFRLLEADEVADIILKQALLKNKLEILIPKYRGWIAKISNLFPRPGFYLEPIFRKIGEKNRKNFIKSHN